MPLVPEQDMLEDKHHKQQSVALMSVFVGGYSCFRNHYMHCMQPTYPYKTKMIIIVSFKQTNQNNS